MLSRPLRAKMELIFEKPKDQIQPGATTLKAVCSVGEFILRAAKENTILPDIAANHRNVVLGRLASTRSTITLPTLQSADLIVLSY